MSLQMIPIFLLLAIIPIASGAANNSYDDCLRVATKFSTTVPNGPVSNILNTTGVNVTCTQLANTSCPGVFTNGTCTWQQKLCITCINGSTVRIHVQSNGLPRRCMLVPSFASIAERNIDFEVNFNPDVSVNAPNQAPSTLSALNNIVCNISNQITVPASSAYAAISMFIPVLAGVAVDGVSILNVNSLNQVDPFYPSGNFTPEGADQCLSHPTGMGEYHYHIASGCIVNPPLGNIDGCTPMIGCANNVANYSLQTFLSYKNLTVIGIAKDGHVIYGPYLSSGAQVISGFDICNGMFYDSIGNYAYFATTTYPYITGCFGPGIYPAFTPSCTTNGPKSYTKSSYAASFSTSNKAAATILPSMNGFFQVFMTFPVMVILFQ